MVVRIGEVEVNIFAGGSDDVIAVSYVKAKGNLFKLMCVKCRSVDYFKIDICSDVTCIIDTAIFRDGISI